MIALISKIPVHPMVSKDAERSVHHNLFNNLPRKKISDRTMTGEVINIHSRFVEYRLMHSVCG